MKRMSLPIDNFISRILELVKRESNLIIKASPGSGKTTRVPPALLDFFPVDQEILILVPRRLAAKMAARRVAEERGESLGQIIGYQFRHENVTSSSTRLCFITEGLLFRRLLQDKNLSRVGCVILDEFHERHLHSDAALSYLRHLQKTKRNDLKLIVMSATLDTQAVQNYLGNCSVIEIEAPCYPVTVSYLPTVPSHPLPKLVRMGVIEAIQKNKQTGNIGDILVFLPGMAEIRKATEALESSKIPGILILPLHGDLPKEEQEKIFSKTTETKVILATNIAESSLTIDGVTTVIDSGLYRQASYSFWSGVPTLKTRPISKASAIQRAGRAGRTAPGHCLRLYTQSDFMGRGDYDIPEIRRADLTQILLEIMNLGISNLDMLEWFENPPPNSVKSSWDLLKHLGALSTSGQLTDRGKKMTSLPLHPRLSRMMIEAEKKGILKEASLLAALINEDELGELDALECLNKNHMPDSARKIMHQILSNFDSPVSQARKNKKEDLCFALLTGFPDRVAQKRKMGKNQAECELLLCLGGSGSINATGIVSTNDYFVVLDIQERTNTGSTKGKTHIRSLCSIKPDWLLELDNDLLKENEEMLWDNNQKKVVQISQINYGNLVLSETVGPIQDNEKAIELYIKKGLNIDVDDTHLSVEKVLLNISQKTDSGPLEYFFGKIRLMKEQFKNLEIPDLTGNSLKTILKKIFSTQPDLSKFLPEQWDALFFTALDYSLIADMQKKLPDQLTLPSGRKVKIHYPFAKSPWVESRLQDFFGLETTPSLLQGKIPLLLHLLAPNRRPVQVTHDLKSFWTNMYPQVRRELARRYPRHKWPEKPN